jgi:hypothetical protein
MATRAGGASLSPEQVDAFLGSPVQKHLNEEFTRLAGDHRCFVEGSTNAAGIWEGSAENSIAALVSGTPENVRALGAAWNLKYHQSAVGIARRARKGEAATHIFLEIHLPTGASTAEAIDYLGGLGFPGATATRQADGTRLFIGMVSVTPEQLDALKAFSTEKGGSLTDSEGVFDFVGYGYAPDILRSTGVEDAAIARYIEEGVTYANEQYPTLERTGSQSVPPVKRVRGRGPVARERGENLTGSLVARIREIDDDFQFHKRTLGPASDRKRVGGGSGGGSVDSGTGGLLRDAGGAETAIGVDAPLFSRTNGVTRGAISPDGTRGTGTAPNPARAEWEARGRAAADRLAELERAAPAEIPNPEWAKWDAARTAAPDELTTLQQRKGALQQNSRPDDPEWATELEDVNDRIVELSKTATQTEGVTAALIAAGPSTTAVQKYGGIGYNRASILVDEVKAGRMTWE